MKGLLQPGNLGEESSARVTSSGATSFPLAIAREMTEKIIINQRRVDEQEVISPPGAPTNAAFWFCFISILHINFGREKQTERKRETKQWQIIIGKVSVLCSYVKRKFILKVSRFVFLV